MQTPESAEYRAVTSIAPDQTSLTTPMSNFATVHRWKSRSIDGQTTMLCSFLRVTLFMAAKRKVALRLGVRAGTVETSFNLIVYVLNSQTLHPSWRKYWVLLVCDTVRSVCAWLPLHLFCLCQAYPLSYHFAYICASLFPVFFS